MTDPSAPARPTGRPTLALASLVLGITGLVLFFFLVPAAVATVLGVLAVRELRTTPGRPGYKMAVTGLVLGSLGTALFVAFAIATAIDQLG